MSIVTKAFLLRVDSLAIGGLGVGRKDGLVVFLPFVAPGELVKARALKKKKDYLIAKPIEIVEASENRISPPCRHFGICGGCLLQHLDYETQILYKGEQVRTALKRIGSIEGVELRPTIPSPKIFRYRNKLEFTFGTQHQGSHLEPILGFHKRNNYWKVIPIEDCLLMPEGGKEILASCLSYLKQNPLSIYQIRSHHGLLRFLMMRHSVWKDEWLVNIITSEEDIRIKGLGDYLQGRKEIRSLVNNINPREAATAIGEREIVLFGDGFLEEMISLREYRLSSNSFFQVNTHVLPILLDTISNSLDICGDEELIDAYSGIGTIGIRMADRVKHVISIELLPSNRELALLNMRRNGIHNMTLLVGRTEDLLAGVLKRDTLLILDPPRSGLHKRVLKSIMEVLPRKVVYISCNPTTLARDLSVMKEGYEIVSVQPIDMFPQTPHVETVVCLRLR